VLLLVQVLGRRTAHPAGRLPSVRQRALLLLGLLLQVLLLLELLLLVCLHAQKRSRHDEQANLLLNTSLRGRLPALMALAARQAGRALHSAVSLTACCCNALPATGDIHAAICSAQPKV
jgi:hypothetical protein